MPANLVVEASRAPAEHYRRAEDPLAELALQAKSGDRESVRRFLEAISPMVQRMTRSVLGSQHPDLEDSVQEALLAALKGLEQFRFEGTVHQYVATIALRRAFTTRRRRAARWRKQESLDVHDEVRAPVPVNGWSTEDIELVEKLLDDLSNAQGQTLFLRIVLEHSVEEIARLTAVPVETVRTRLKRGKDALRKRLVLPFWRSWFSKGPHD